MNRRLTILLLIVLALLVYSAYRWHQIQKGYLYSVTNLGRVVETRNCGIDLNDRGDIIFYSSVKGGEILGSLRKADGKEEPLFGKFENAKVVPVSINNRRQICGGIFDSTGTSRAFVWDATMGIQYLKAPREGSSFALEINDRGQVAGRIAYANDTQRPIRWQSPQSMGYILNSSQECNGYAYRISAKGVIVGRWISKLGSHISASFIWSSTGEDITPSSLGDEWLSLSAVNNQGAILGFDERAGLGSVWTQGGEILSNIPTLGGSDFYAWDLNDRGDVVGSSSYEQNLRLWGFLRAFLLKPEILSIGQPLVDWAWARKFSGYLHTQGKTLDLNKIVRNPSGWRFTEPLRINNRGQIVGKGTLNEVEHFFLLNPIED